MTEYFIVRAIHVISVIVWLGVIPTDLLLRKTIRAKKGTESEKTLLSFWLKITNLGGMAGATGIILSGMFLSISMNYGFFQFASGANHWLYTKQFVITIVMILIGAVGIPTAKKIRLGIEESVAENSHLSEEVYKKIALLEKVLTAVNLLIVINLLLALTKDLM